MDFMQGSGIEKMFLYILTYLNHIFNISNFCFGYI